MYQIFSRQNLKKRRKRDFVYSQEIRQKCNVRELLLVMSLVTCGTFLTTLNLGSRTVGQDKTIAIESGSKLPDFLSHEVFLGL